MKKKMVLSAFFTAGFFVFCTLILSAGLSSCGVNSKAVLETEVFNQMDSSSALEGRATVKATMQKETSAPSYYAEGDDVQIKPLVALERKLVYRGAINLQVKNLTESMDAVNLWLKENGGYIASSFAYEDHVEYSVRIPAASFDKAMTSLGSLGRALSKSITTEDVTEHYYDIETRLAARKILGERLQSYLKNAKDMKDMLAIEAELNNVLSDIEAAEGQLRLLNSLIVFSTITIELRLPYNTTKQGFSFPDFKGSWQKLLSNTLIFFNSFFFALLYIIIYGIPLVLILALLYWIGFGRIGLIRRLFSLCCKGFRAPR